jgi:hypothetical protein
MQRFATALLVIALFAVAAETLQAQDRGFGIAGNAGAFIPGGVDFEELDSGFGAEGVLSWGWASGFEVGAAFGWSTHDAEDEEVDLTRLFGEVGWRFNSQPVNSVVFMPFVKARGGYARANVDSDSDGLDFDGYGLGGAAGLEVWLSSGFGLTGQASLDFLSLEGDENDADAERSTGTLVGITGGVKIRLN